MRRALVYDPQTAMKEDNGEFWIDWKSVQRFYDVMYLNWDPGMFSHRYPVHFVWHQVSLCAAVGNGKERSRF